MNTEDNLKIKEFKNILEGSIINAEQVFVLPHTAPDLDAIASAIGLYYIIKTKFKKTCFIVVNEPMEKIEAGVRKIIEREKDLIPFISLKKYLELKNNNDLLITTDVNKKDRVAVSEYLENFKDIVVIDHHNEGDKTIKTDKKFITCGVSSVSEIITKLFSEFRLAMSENIATYLLAGIKLDTINLAKNTDEDTLDMLKKLFKSGAKNEEVQQLFQANYESDIKINELIKRLKFRNFQYAIGAASEEELYSREELAKAADKTLTYGVDAAFIIGFLDEDKKVIGISARSNGKLNVGMLMHEFNGGGNPTSAAAVKNDTTISEVEEQLTLKLQLPYSK